MPFERAAQVDSTRNNVDIRLRHVESLNGNRPVSIEPTESDRSAQTNDQLRKILQLTNYAENRSISSITFRNQSISAQSEPGTGANRVRDLIALRTFQRQRYHSLFMN